MSLYNTLKAKVGLGGWTIYDGVYMWKSAWAEVHYIFYPEGILRLQHKGTHPIYADKHLHAKGTDKYKQLKCQLLALDDGIYHPPDWWRDKLADHKYGRKRGAKQIENFNLVEKYLFKEV